MKTLYIIGGTMGVGKSTVCQVLKRRLPESVFLDGDWCWDASPFQVTDETKDMVMRNICFLLNQFLHCSAYSNVIFCWVMHEQNIIDSILGNIDTTMCHVRTISLVCDEEALKSRLLKDVANGIRSEEAVERSVARLPLYDALKTEKIDTGNKSVENIVKEILEYNFDGRKFIYMLEDVKNEILIRNASLEDLDAIAEVEKSCFPAAEAATKEEFIQRLRCYGNHFWLMFEEGRLVAFVDGMVTDQADLTDEMYEKADLHQEDGAWQMIFGVNTIPECRKRGYAGRLLERAIADAKEQGRKGLVLTCKDELVHYYAKFGFQNEGVSESVHGNVVWNQMRLVF